MCFRNLLFFLIIHVSHIESIIAADCNSTNDPIQKLICQTEPALLEALNPGLKIPLCNSQDAKPKVVPGHLPVSAVFVTCTDETAKACGEIAKSVLKNGRGATVNVVVQRDRMHTIQSRLEEIVQFSKASHSNLNIIPVKSSVPSYARDPGLFQNQSGSTRIIANPYAQQGILGADVWEEVAKACSLGFDTSYRHLAKFDSTFREVFNDLRSPLLPSHSKAQVLGAVSFEKQRRGYAA